MKVLLIHQSFVTPSEGGGTRHYELLRGLGPKGVNATVICPTTTYMGDLMRPGETSDAPNLTIVRVPTPSGQSKGFVRRAVGYFAFARRAAEAARREPGVDVVWGTSPPLPQAWVAARVARRKAVPFVVEIRDLWPDFPIEMGILRNPALIRGARMMERTVYRAADHFIVNSPAYTKHLVDHGVAQDRVTLIPNGVDCAAIEPEVRRDETRQRLGLDGKTIILYAGAHGPANDLDVLLDAAPRLPAGIQVVLVGDGKDKARLQQRVRAQGDRNVTFLDPWPKDQMPDLLAAADACLAILKPLPGFTKTYPNKVFDYMSAARPTILAIDGVIRDVIEEAGAGTFVPPGDAAALAAAIELYHSDPALGRAQGRAARAFVLERFDRSRQVAQLERCLVGLVR